MDIKVIVKEMLEKIIQLEPKVEEIESKESNPGKTNHVAKIGELPKKVSIIKENSNAHAKRGQT